MRSAREAEAHQLVRVLVGRHAVDVLRDDQDAHEEDRGVERRIEPDRHVAREIQQHVAGRVREQRREPERQEELDRTGQLPRADQQ